MKIQGWSWFLRTKLENSVKTPLISIEINLKLFSEQAHYYKAFAIIYKDGDGFESTIIAKKVLNASLKVLDNSRNNIVSRN